MKKTIAILTSEESFINNYGAALQGYALYSTLDNLGLEPMVVRYKGGEARNSQFEYRLFQAKRALGRIWHKLLDKKAKPLNPDVIKKVRSREKIFLDFSKKYMSFWNTKRVSWQDLRKSYPKCDYYICGSDQIWNPYFKGGYNDFGYFLAFAPKDSVKIAYAPSFGSDDIPPTAVKSLGKLLKDFNAISVREKSGVDIIKKYTRLKAEHVLDPTLLKTPEEWREIAKKPANLPEKYILVYRFADSDKTKSMIDGIAAKTGLPVISLPLSNVALQDDYNTIFDAGPQEFIGLIDNASLVCTDSFHATVFSILMKTPVCVFLRENYDNGNSMNSRIYSLLSMLKLEQVILNSESSLEDAMKCLSVDYGKAYAVLEKEKDRSIDFLKNAINCS